MMHRRETLITSACYMDVLVNNIYLALMQMPYDLVFKSVILILDFQTLRKASVLESYIL